MKNATAQVSSSQTVVGTKQYDAFGNLTSSSGSWNGPFSYGGAFGYQSETDTGYQLLGHRYYDPTTGRFLTRDPIGDGRNWYAYCENNPITAADPTGLVLIDLGSRPLDLREPTKRTDPRDSQLTVEENATPWYIFPKTMAVTLDDRSIRLPAGVSAFDFLESEDEKMIWWYNHEVGHIEQASYYGVFYIAFYLMEWAMAGFSYSNHPWEREAEERAANYDHRVPATRSLPFYDERRFTPTRKQWYEHYTRGQ